MNPLKLADCVVNYYEQFRPDAAWVSADTSITAQTMGARVDFVGDDQPMCGIDEPLVKSLSDIEKIVPANPAVIHICLLTIYFFLENRNEPYI